MIEIITELGLEAPKIGEQAQKWAPKLLAALKYCRKEIRILRNEAVRIYGSSCEKCMFAIPLSKEDSELFGGKDEGVYCFGRGGMKKAKIPETGRFPNCPYNGLDVEGSRAKEKP